MNATGSTDAELVAQSLSGSREAFNQIIERYKTLVCSLAYSATGNLSQSEDVAQDTFVAAWTNLRSLREPEKLRPWLCGIARNRTRRNLRADASEPACQGESLETAQEIPLAGPLPSDQAISREEEAILWRSLERIPELYREPLILFYRQQQSIEHVAAELELTEDAVKQRLSRGRKLLQEEVQAFVENTLRRSVPDQAFSAAVLAAIPVGAGPIAATGVSAGAKGAAAAKSTFLTACLAPLAPFLGIVAGVGACWLVIHDSTPDRTRRSKTMAGVVAFWVVYLTLAVVGEQFVHALGHHYQWSDRMRFAVEIGFWWAFLTVTIAFLHIATRRRWLRDQAQIAAGEIVVSTAPMKPGRLAVVVAGGFLLFSWFIRFVWHDRAALEITVAAMVLMGVRTYFEARAKAATAVMEVIGRNLNYVGLLILLVINLRVEVWVAAAYNVKPAEASNYLPIWMVPAASLALICWAAGFTVWAKREKAVTM